MTRWARGGSANKKKALDATSWQEMVNQENKTATQKSQDTSGSSQTESHENKIHKKKEFKKKSKKKQPHNTEVLSKRKSSGSEGSGLPHDRGQISGDSAEKEAISRKHIKGAEYRTVEAGWRNTQRTRSIKYDVPHLDEATEKRLSEVIRKDERSERRRVKRKEKRDIHKLCFNCRKPGHNVSECPETKMDVDHGTGICFKCGSTEHNVATCRLKLPPGEYPYAKCFICGEMGHLSKQCPDNPRGLYPKGGCCRLCGSVEHYRKDCPEMQKQQGIRDLTLPTVKPGHFSADDEISLHESRKVKLQKKKPKVVTF